MDSDFLRAPSRPIPVKMCTTAPSCGRGARNSRGKVRQLRRPPSVASAESGDRLPDLRDERFAADVYKKHVCVYIYI